MRETVAGAILSLLMPTGAWRFSTMIKSMTHTPLLSQTNPEGCLRGTKKRNATLFILMNDSGKHKIVA